MCELKNMITPYSIPNITIKNIHTRENVKLYAVSSNGESVVVGPIKNENNRDWMRYCWEMPTEELLKNYTITSWNYMV